MEKCRNEQEDPEGGNRWEENRVTCPGNSAERGKACDEEGMVSCQLCGSCCRFKCDED